MENSNNPIHCSDDEDNPEDEEDGDEDASAMAATVATAVTFGDISAVFKSPSRQGIQLFSRLKYLNNR